MNESRVAHISTVVTVRGAFADIIDLLRRHAWRSPDARRIMVMGEQKTSRVSMVVLTANETPPAALTLALERIACSLDPDASSPVLAHESFDVSFVDVTDWENANAVRLTRLGIVPSGVNVLEGIGREATSRLRATTPGFRGAIALTNAPSGKAIFIELFSSRAALRESEVTAYFDARNAREAGVLTEPPEHEVYQLYSLIADG